MQGEAGQATLELVLSSALVIVALSGAGWLLKAQWERSRCAYLVFEATHARLTGRLFVLPEAKFGRIEIGFAEDGQFIQGEASCGSGSEKVRLPKLAAPEAR